MTQVNGVSASSGEYQPKEIQKQQKQSNNSVWSASNSENNIVEQSDINEDFWNGSATLQRILKPYIEKAEQWTNELKQKVELLYKQFVLKKESEQMGSSLDDMLKGKDPVLEFKIKNLKDILNSLKNPNTKGHVAFHNNEKILYILGYSKDKDQYYISNGNGIQKFIEGEAQLDEIINLLLKMDLNMEAKSEEFKSE